MKKTILALVVASAVSMASDTTLKATMGLMSQGLNQVQTGFMYNNTDDILKGISIMENANAIFSQVDLQVFIPQNHKIQVTKNINSNLTKSLKELRQDIEAKKFASATKSYSEVMTNCLACHSIVRGW